MLKAGAAFDLSSLDFRGDHFAKQGFARAQVVARTKGKVQKAGINAAQLNGHEAERSLALRGSKAGHGSDAGHNKNRQIRLKKRPFEHGHAGLIVVAVLTMREVERCCRSTADFLFWREK